MWRARPFSQSIFAATRVVRSLYMRMSDISRRDHNSPIRIRCPQKPRDVSPGFWSSQRNALRKIVTWIPKISGIDNIPTFSTLFLVMDPQSLSPMSVTASWSVKACPLGPTRPIFFRRQVTLLPFIMLPCTIFFYRCLASCVTFLKGKANTHTFSQSATATHPNPGTIVRPRDHPQRRRGLLSDARTDLFIRSGLPMAGLQPYESREEG